MARTKRKMGTVALLALATAACGGGTTSKKAVSVPVYTINASEAGTDTFKFDVPASMKGGVVSLKLVNLGKGPHDFQLVKATAGHTIEDVTKQVASEDAPLESWLEAAGGVGAAAPSGTAQATVNLGAGKYWYFCTESTDEGVAHATHGMAGELTLTGSSGAAMPAANATMTASEYQFATNGFKSGANTIAFSNRGQQLHHALILPISPGKTLDDVKKALADENSEAPPPVDFKKGVASAVINPGQTLIFEATLPAGNYAVLCFMPDKGTAGPPHAAKGMIVQLTIA